MIKACIGAFALLSLVACGSDSPKELRRHAEPYIVNSALADPANHSVTISITVDPPATEADVKTAAEMAIAKYRNEYTSITIKSYLRSSDPSGLPYATSMFADGVITHFITPQAASQKIPTH